MSFKGKPVKVLITGDAKEEFEKLNETVGEEISKGVTGSDHQTLFNSIKQKIELLRDNPQYGNHLEKRKIPKEYISKYDVNNLWKVNLAGAWRRVYTISGSEIEIISLILDILDHKNYEKKAPIRKLFILSKI